MNADPPTDAEFAALVNAIYLHSPEAIGVSAGGIHRLVNPTYVGLFGYESAADLLGRPILDLIAPSSRALVRDYAARRGEPGVPARYEVRGLRRDGTEFDMDVRVTGYEQGGVMHSLVILRDVTARNETQRSLAESREFYRAMFEVNTSVKLLLNPSTGRIVDANQAAAAFYGWPIEELREKNIREINTNSEAQIRREMEAARDGGRRYFEFQHRTASGEVRDVEVYTGPVDVRGETHLLSIIHDVTGRKALEEQLRQAQKMEAVGRLAGGVAHDFNNLLTVMLGYGELAIETIPHGTGLRRHVEGMVAAANRARDLTRQLLAFSRRQVLQPQVVSLGVVIRDLEGLLRRTLGPTIELRVATEPDLPPTLADPGQLDQVLLNLVINARDAMPEGGVLTIGARRSRGDPALEGRVPEGDYVVLEVIDSGIGMDSTTLARVFEPFFTTKAPGEGTGLGLSTVYGIVAQSGGHVLVDSEPGRGAIFLVCLPVHDGGREREVTGPMATPSSLPGRALVVDDQEEVRAVMVALLESVGVTVVEAAGADEAAERFRADPGGFDLLLTDVVMPGRSGIDLANELVRARPALPVLLVSGDLRDHGAVALPAAWGYLQKPFTRQSLIDRVGEVMRGAAVRTAR